MIRTLPHTAEHDNNSVVATITFLPVRFVRFYRDDSILPVSVRDEPGRLEVYRNEIPRTERCSSLVVVMGLHHREHRDSMGGFSDVITVGKK